MVVVTTCWTILVGFTTYRDVSDWFEEPEAPGKGDQSSIDCAGRVCVATDPVTDPVQSYVYVPCFPVWSIEYFLPKRGLNYQGDHGQFAQYLNTSDSSTDGLKWGNFLVLGFCGPKT